MVVVVCRRERVVRDYPMLLVQSRDLLKLLSALTDGAASSADAPTRRGSAAAPPAPAADMLVFQPPTELFRRSSSDARSDPRCV